MMDNGKLLGFALFFNYKETKDAQKESFNEIFGVADGEALPYYEKIHRNIEIMEGNVLYLLSIAVSPVCRRCGIASELLDYVLSHYNEYSIVSDVSNEDSLEMYKKRNFEISKIEEGYFFVSMEQKISSQRKFIKSGIFL